MKHFLHMFSATLALTLYSGTAFAGGNSVGDSITKVAESFSNAPTLISTFSYLAGIMAVAWAIFTFRDHVDGGGGAPSLSDAVKRMLMGGAFLALPSVLDATVATLIGTGTFANQGMTGFTGQNCSGSADTLDAMAVCFISDIEKPVGMVLSAFAYIGGLILILLGISRITRSYQEGARGPTGIGTIFTFLAGGALMSSSQMMAAFSTSIFGDANAATMPDFTGQVGEALGEQGEVVKTTIQAVVAFIGIVGWIAFIRGWFVLRAVADGSQQASVAQALTFLFGGALAVNIGDVVNALSATLGGSLGLTFT